MPSVRLRNSTWSSMRFSATSSWRVWLAPGRAARSAGARPRKRRRQAHRVHRVDVVVEQPVDQHQRAGQSRRVVDQRGAR